MRDQLMKQQGQLNYDHIRREFGKLSNQLGCNGRTCKDLRHLFSTCLENAGVPTLLQEVPDGAKLWS